MDVTETQLLVRRNQSATLPMLHNSIQEYLLHKTISNSSKYPSEYYTRSELTFPLPSNTRLVLQWRHQEYSTDGAGSLPWSFQQHWLPLQLLGRAGAVPNDGEITHAQLGAIRNHLTWPTSACPWAKDTFALTEPLSPACALHPSHSTTGLDSPDQQVDNPLSLCPWHLAKGSECKENRLCPYKYIYGHMHTSYTCTSLFSSLESTNQRM